MIGAAVAFTARGAQLALQLQALLERDGRCTCPVFAPQRQAERTDGVFSLGESLSDFVGRCFAEQRALVFVGAAGIAVRAIAPHLKDKLTDPPVLVIDEAGQFVIPLLSGHVGGANRMAAELAERLGAQAVITTATDVNRRFAIDEWAARQGLHIGEREIAKEISAALLDGETVGFCSDFVVEGALPPGLVEQDAGALGVCVSYSGTIQPFVRTLHLIPRVVTLGVGCRRGVSSEAFEAAVCAMLEQGGLSPHCLCTVATIDCKAQEPCIIAFCEKYHLPLCTASAEVLAAVEGSFSSSDFVRETVGVDNVCERAAVLISGGRLLLGKKSRDAVTVAAAAEDFRPQFPRMDREDNR